jgi:hypothetical protein
LNAYEDVIRTGTNKQLNKNDGAIPDIELEDSHNIFAPVGKSKFKKLKTEIAQETSSKVKTALGKKIENFIKDKSKRSQLFKNYYEDNYYLFDMNAKYELPLLNKRQLDRKSFKVKVFYTNNTIEALESCMMKIRGERPKNKPVEPVKAELAKTVIAVADDSDDDIFKDIVKETKPIPVLKDDQDNEDDFLNYKNFDLSTLLKPFGKKK